MDTFLESAFPEERKSDRKRERKKKKTTSTRRIWIEFPLPFASSTFALYFANDNNYEASSAPFAFNAISIMSAVQAILFTL